MNLPLFLHVLGAIVLVGAMASVTVLAWAGARRPQSALLANAAFRTMLVLAVPSWLVMRLAGQWAYSKTGFSGQDDPNWVGLGFIVGDVGLPILLLATGFAWWWVRRPASGWQSRVVGVLAPLYLVALAIAWWVMTAKPAL
jgi:hypothetical protein